MHAINNQQKNRLTNIQHMYRMYSQNRNFLASVLWLVESVMKHGPTSSKLLLLCLKVQSTGFSSDSNFFFFFFFGGGGGMS